VQLAQWLRTEFAIRMSLGAASGRVMRQLITESLMLALTGGVAGLLLSRAAAGDWLYLVAGAALISLVGLFASLLPARRAASVEPLIALRYE
jgi:putative ABC transport system permease protein